MPVFESRVRSGAEFGRNRSAYAGLFDALRERRRQVLKGGAEMRSTVSGVSDYPVGTELEAISKARDIVAALDWRKQRRTTTREPLYDPKELDGVVATDLKQPYDVREVIARIVDGSEFREFKPGLRLDAGMRLRLDPWRAGRHPRQQRRSLFRPGETVPAGKRLVLIEPRAAA
jgi:hypothetical protein